MFQWRSVFGKGAPFPLEDEWQGEVLIIDCSLNTPICQCDMKIFKKC